MINTFSTLIWLELRKFGVFGLGLLLGVAAWFLLARQIFAWTGSNLESAIAVVSTTAFFCYVCKHCAAGGAGPGFLA